MVYVFLAIALLLVAVLLTRLRVRLLLSPERKILFVGLGRSGPEVDFIARVICIKLFGLKVRQIEMQKSSKVEAEVSSESGHWRPTKLETVKPSEAPRPKRHRSWKLLLEILASSTRALWQYVAGLVKGVIVEEAEGELALGFDSPDVTGRVYGYYMALAGMVPLLTRRFALNPDFSGKGVAGRARVSLAVPMYVIVYRTVILLAKLPIRKIIKYSRGEKKGESHGE